MNPLDCPPDPAQRPPGGVLGGLLVLAAVAVIGAAVALLEARTVDEPPAPAADASVATDGASVALYGP